MYFCEGSLPDQRHEWYIKRQKGSQGKSLVIYINHISNPTVKYQIYALNGDKIVTSSQKMLRF